MKLWGRKMTIWLLVAMVLSLPAAVSARSAWYTKYGISHKSQLSQPGAVPALARALADPRANVRKAAAKYLVKTGLPGRQALPHLIHALNDPHPRVRAQVLVTMGVLGQPSDGKVLRALLNALDDRDANVRKGALVALKKLGYGGNDFKQALGRMVSNEPHPKVRALAAKMLAGMGGTLTVGAMPPVPLPQTHAVPAAMPPSPESMPPVAAGSSQDSLYSSSHWVGPSQLKLRYPKARETNKDAVALIIGNRHYQRAGRGVPDVDYAHNDADAVHGFVIQSLGYRKGNIILLKDASQADLIGALGSENNPKGKLYDWIRPQKSDLFVFYSGHGAPGLKDGAGYLMPVDGDPSKVELNGYALKTLYANLEALPSRKTTVVLDACFSGGSARGALVKNASSISLKVKATAPKLSNTIVLTASNVSQVASWDTKVYHGLFTRCFLEGMAGAADEKAFGNRDGKITLGELKRYLEEEVTYTARRNYGREQHPQVMGDLNHVFISD